MLVRGKGVSDAGQKEEWYWASQREGGVLDAGQKGEWYWSEGRW